MQPAIKESEERIVSKVINGVVQQIESRGMEVGTVTRDGMEQSINACFQAHISPGKAIPSILQRSNSVCFLHRRLLCSSPGEFFDDCVLFLSAPFTYAG